LNPKTNNRVLNFWHGPVESIQLFFHAPEALRLEQIQWIGDKPEQRAAYHHLLQIIRNRTLIEFLIRKHTRKSPKPKLKAILALGIVQLLDTSEKEGSHAKIIHHTVEITRQICSDQESRFVNAVCRNIEKTLPQTLQELADNRKWNILYSHPQWLIDRWIQQYGSQKVVKILEWNQRIPDIYIHDFSGVFKQMDGDTIGAELDRMGLEPTIWEDFYLLKKSGRHHIDRLMEQSFYIQDPSTRMAPSLFQLSDPPQNVLDACAAPGGKSIHLFKRFQKLGSAPVNWIATDLTQDRLNLIQRNMERLKITGIQTQVADWESEEPNSHLKSQFQWVILDAPCTSVGVIQKHPEIRWRLIAADYTKVPKQQLSILKNCAQTLAPGGQLVYSTCSFDFEENQQVIAHFLESDIGSHFSLISGQTLHPGETGHDGIGYFLLKKETQNFI